MINRVFGVRAVRGAALFVSLVRYGLTHRAHLYRAHDRRASESGARFVLTVSRRVWDLGLFTGEFQFVLLNEAWRAFDYADRMGADLKGVQLLRLAEAFKTCGFFWDAEWLLRELSRRPAVADLALLSLADLLLVKAGWKQESDEYAAVGATFDGYALDAVEGPWGSQSFDMAIAAARRAAAAAPGSPHPYLLLGISEGRRGRWAPAAAAFKAFDARQAYPAWEDRMAQAVPALARDHRRAAELGEQAVQGQVAQYPRQGFEAWQTQVARIRSSRDLAASRWREALPSRSLSLQATLVRNRTVAPYRRELSFAAAGVCRYDRALVLAPHGMLLVNGELIGDSAHVLARNFPIFTSSVQAVAEGHALICGPPPSRKPPASGAILIGQNANYYHFLVEELPRLQLLADKPDLAGRPLLIDWRAPAWQLDLLRRAGFDAERLLYADFTEDFCVEDVVSPGRLSGRMIAHPDAVRFARDTLAPQADASSPKPGKRVYLSRPTNARRGMLNERMVAERLGRAGFVRVDPSRMSIDEQVEFFSDVEVMAGPGGAAFTNLLFAPRSARALLLTPADVAVESFTSIAAALGQRATWCAGVGRPRAHATWIWSIFDFEIDPQDLDLALETVL